MTLAVGDRVRVIARSHPCYGQIGVIVAACKCFASCGGTAVWKVSLARERCLIAPWLRKVDDDDDSRKVVSWDDVPGGKPKVREVETV